MPPEYVPQVGFLQVMHIVAPCSMKFSTFSSEIYVDGRGKRKNIASETFFIRMSWSPSVHRRCSTSSTYIFRDSCGFTGNNRKTINIV